MSLAESGGVRKKRVENYWQFVTSQKEYRPSGYFIYVNYSFMYNLNVLKNVLKILSYSWKIFIKWSLKSYVIKKNLF